MRDAHSKDVCEPNMGLFLDELAHEEGRSCQDMANVAAIVRRGPQEIERSIPGQSETRQDSHVRSRQEQLAESSVNCRASPGRADKGKLIGRESAGAGEET